MALTAVESEKLRVHKTGSGSSVFVQGGVMPQAAPQHPYGFPGGQRRNSALVWSLEGYVPFETSSVRTQETSWDSLYAQRGFLCCDLRQLRLRLASVERDLYNLRRKYRKCAGQLSTAFELSDHSYWFTRSPDYNV